MATKIQKAMYRFVQIKKLRRILRGIRRIQNLWRCRMEYKNFLITKMKIRLIQRWLHRQYLKKQQKLYRNSCISIQNYFRRYFDFYHYEMIKIQIVEVQRLIRGGLARIKARKLKFMRNLILNQILSPAWDYLVYSKVMLIQKIVRGYLAKSRNYEIVKRARRVRILMVRCKAARVIQKNAKGFIVRKRMERLNKAAYYIQGYFRMKWLSAMLANLKKSSLIIQVGGFNN
jgi:IQ calmodulin-binding motif